MQPRVLGIVQSRNEWPMLGLSILHAFRSGIDTVIAVDHDSDDLTPAGLVELEKAFGSRLRIMKLAGDRFLQESTKNFIRLACAPYDFDWIYFFDADEFLIEGTPGALLTTLSQASENVDGISYAMENWICPSDFDDHIVDDFLRIQVKASQFRPIFATVEENTSSIIRGDLTFFDFPCEVKFIFRNAPEIWTDAGSHRAFRFDDSNINVLHASDFSVAHLPITSVGKLKIRAEQGRRLEALGLPFAHGWQSRLLTQVTEQKSLEEFWSRHTAATSTGTPAVNDLAFHDAILDAVSDFSELTGHVSGSEFPSPETSFPFHDMIEVFHHTLSMLQDFRVKELELDGELRNLRGQSSAFQRRLEEIESSTSWRLTAPLRWVTSKMRRALRRGT